MNIAYVISAYKYPEQLIRLISRLNSETTNFFVHVDKKTDSKIYCQVVDSLRHFSNVYLLERHKCYWGDFSHVNATIKGIKEIFSRNIPFDYIFLLTGQDYPIKSNSQIEKFLIENQRKSFIEYFPLPCDIWYKNGLNRIEYWHLTVFGKLLAFPTIFGKYLPFPKRKFPKGLKPFGGSSYWCLSRECIEYVHNFINQNNEIVDFFKYVLIPDETFFQTVILNSPLKNSVKNDNLKYIKWIAKAPSPIILGKNDFEQIMSSEKLFARKFDLTKDADILDMIDQKILTNGV